MIHIRRLYDSLQVEVELRGVPSIPEEKFYIPFELLNCNFTLNLAYKEFRLLGHGTEDALRMPITQENHVLFGELRQLMFEVHRNTRNQFDHTQTTAQNIARTSVLA